MKTIVYLHGFISSPRSRKAVVLGDYLANCVTGVGYEVPELHHRPARAFETVMETCAKHPVADLTLVGSSLGGFYATAVAERRGCRAVLLNPGVDPARDLADAIGATTAWHSDEPFDFRPEYVAELRAIGPPAQLTNLNRYFAVIAKGDEVLSWREMSERYAGAHIRLIEGSDHALSDFDDHFPAVLAFLGLGPAR